MHLMIEDLHVSQDCSSTTTEVLIYMYELEEIHVLCSSPELDILRAGYLDVLNACMTYIITKCDSDYKES